MPFYPEHVRYFTLISFYCKVVPPGERQQLVLPLLKNRLSLAYLLPHFSLHSKRYEKLTAWTSVFDLVSKCPLFSIVQSRCETLASFSVAYQNLTGRVW